MDCCTTRQGHETKSFTIMALLSCFGKCLVIRLNLVPSVCRGSDSAIDDAWTCDWNPVRPNAPLLYQVLCYLQYMILYAMHSICGILYVLRVTRVHISDVHTTIQYIRNIESYTCMNKIKTVQDSYCIPSRTIQ